MKKLYTIAALLGLLAVTDTNNSGSVIRRTIEVPAGEFRDAKNNDMLYSEGYFGCSALVIDYGDGALLAHALPESEEHWRGRNLNTISYLHTDNVVEQTVGYIRNNGINPKSCFAIVDAGQEKDMKIILRDLRHEGIRVKKSMCANFKGRNVSYTPSDNKLYVDILD